MILQQDRTALHGKLALSAMYDRWVNNAGEVTQNKLLSDLDTSEITQVGQKLN